MAGRGSIARLVLKRTIFALSNDNFDRSTALILIIIRENVTFSMKFIEKKQTWQLFLAIRVSQHVFSGKVGAIASTELFFNRPNMYQPANQFFQPSKSATQNGIANVLATKNALLCG